MNLEDIAKKAGVSRSTVSRVINNDIYVSSKTREKVMAVIEQEGFSPNPAARSLVTQRTQTIGLVIPLTPSVVFLDDAFYFPILMQGVAEAAYGRDYGIMLWLGQSSESEGDFYNRIIKNRRMDGLIVSSTPSNYSLVDRLLEKQVPFVQVERPVQYQSEINYISVDNVKAGQDAVDHLINTGRRRIGIITGEFTIPDAVDRFEGYKRALKNASLPFDEDLVFEGQFSRRSGYLGARALLEQHVDAIFACTDLMALGALQALQDFNVSVPEEVAVVGFDDLPSATLVKPQLTTVRQPILQKGVRAANVLIDLIEGCVEPPQQILLPTQLVIRESCGAVTLKT